MNIHNLFYLYILLTLSNGSDPTTLSTQKDFEEEIESPFSNDQEEMVNHFLSMDDLELIENVANIDDAFQDANEIINQDSIYEQDLNRPLDLLTGRKRRPMIEDDDSEPSTSKYRHGLSIPQENEFDLKKNEFDIYLQDLNIPLEPVTAKKRRLDDDSEPSTSVKQVEKEQQIAEHSKLREAITTNTVSLDESKLDQIKTLVKNRLQNINKATLLNKNITKNFENMYNVLTDRNVYLSKHNKYQSIEVREIVKYIRNEKFKRLLENINIKDLYNLNKETNQIETIYLFHAEYIAYKTSVDIELVRDYIRFKFNCITFQVWYFTESDTTKIKEACKNEIIEVKQLHKLFLELMTDVSNINIYILNAKLIGNKQVRVNIMKNYEIFQKEKNNNWKLKYNKWKKQKHQTSENKHIDILFINRIDFILEKAKSAIALYTMDDNLVSKSDKQKIIDKYDTGDNVRDIKSITNTYMKKEYLINYRNLQIVKLINTTSLYDLYKLSGVLTKMKKIKFDMAANISKSINISEEKVKDLMKYLRNIQLYQVTFFSDDEKINIIEYYNKDNSHKSLISLSKNIMVHPSNIKKGYDSIKQIEKRVKLRESKQKEANTEIYATSGCDDITSGLKRYAYKCISKKGRIFERKQDIIINPKFGGKENLKMVTYNLKRIKNKQELYKRSNQLRNNRKIGKYAKLGIAVGAVTGSILGTLIYSNQQENDRNIKWH